MPLQMLFQNAKSSLVRSFVRAKERAIIAFCVADVTNNTSFFWGRKVVVATKSFFFLFFFFLVEFQSAFFFMLYLGFQMVFFSSLTHSGKREFQCCMKKHFEQHAFARETGHAHDTLWRSDVDG